MSDIQILEQSAEEMIHIDQTFDLVYMDPPFGLQRDFKMQEEDGTEKSFSDKWSSFDNYVDWYADIINKAWSKLNKDGWMYCHNNFIGNALVMSKIDVKIQSSFYTNISWKRSGPKNNIKNGWGNIVDSIIVFRKGNPYFDVEYTSLLTQYMLLIVSKTKMQLVTMHWRKLLVKKVVLVPDLSTKVIIHSMGFV